MPVQLKSGKVVVAETVSNRFGEFQMEYEQQSRLKLCIDLQDSKNIQVPLKKFIRTNQPPRAGRPHENARRRDKPSKETYTCYADATSRCASFS